MSDRLLTAREDERPTLGVERTDFCDVKGCDEYANGTSVGPVDLCRKHSAQTIRAAREWAEAEVKRELNKRSHKPGTMVYFARLRDRSDDLIKIGVTTHLAGRMRMLQAEPLLVIEGNYVTEQFLHQEFAADRVHGEWFRPSEKLLLLIEHLAAEKETANDAA